MKIIKTILLKIRSWFIDKPPPPPPPTAVLGTRMILQITPEELALSSITVASRLGNDFYNYIEQHEQKTILTELVGNLRERMTLDRFHDFVLNLKDTKSFMELLLGIIKKFNTQEETWVN